MSDPTNARYQQLQMDLVRARENHALAQHHESVIEEIRREIGAREARHRELVRDAANRASNMAKLERLSLKRIRALVRDGVGEAKIREEIEAQAAEDAVSASTEELARLTQDLYRFEDELTRLGNTTTAVDVARAAVEVHVERHHPAVKAQVSEIENLTAAHRAHVVECQEAIVAGQRAAHELQLLGDDVVEVRQYLIMEPFKGLFFTVEKDRMLRVTTERQRVATHDLQNFVRELLDTDVGVALHAAESSNDGDPLSFQFGNFLTDLQIDEDIARALFRTRQVHNEVQSAVEALITAMEDDKAEIAALDAAKIDLLARPQDVLDQP